MDQLLKLKRVRNICKDNKLLTLKCRSKVTRYCEFDVILVRTLKNLRDLGIKFRHFKIFEETPTIKLVGMKKFRAKQFIKDDFHNFDTALTAKGGIRLYCIEVYYVLQ